MPGGTHVKPVDRFIPARKADTIDGVVSDFRGAVKKREVPRWQNLQRTASKA